MDSSSEPRRFPPPNNQSFGPSTFEQQTTDILQRHELLIYSVLVIVLLSLAAVVIGGISLVLDQMHFNNQVYRDGYVQPVTVTQTVVKPEGLIVRPTE